MMSQISEIPASAYTREMETLGALPDILTFDGEPESTDPRDTTVAASAVAGYGVPGQVRDEPDAQLSVRGLRFTGPAPPLDSRYQTATLGAQLVLSLLGVTTQARYTVQGCMSYEMVFRFWVERIRTRLEAWRELPEEARPATPAYTREERDQAARSFLFYIISS
ncbi:hypothetical protein JCGZ_03591 [Jatropha curcas]|uniref:Aminotransferase-like plant mobile domain-containing protein n=1 Tax=Jatropha curcas TaxID=180498 RepID=A0A067JNM5_JATCU|nr:hypothetical protein JCGZ_03591 [Jatropha curcas]